MNRRQYIFGALLLMSLIATLSCVTISRLATPPKNDSGFLSSGIASDGETIAFAFRRKVLIPGVDGFGGYDDKFLENRIVLGVYNTRTGKLRVLHRLNGKGWYPYSWNARILEICDNRAWIAEYGGGNNGSLSQVWQHL